MARCQLAKREPHGRHRVGGDSPEEREGDMGGLVARPPGPARRGTHAIDETRHAAGHGVAHVDGDEQPMRQTRPALSAG